MNNKPTYQLTCPPCFVFGLFLLPLLQIDMQWSVCREGRAPGRVRGFAEVVCWVCCCSWSAGPPGISVCELEAAGLCADGGPFFARAAGVLHLREWSLKPRTRVGSDSQPTDVQYGRLQSESDSPME